MNWQKHLQRLLVLWAMVMWTWPAGAQTTRRGNGDSEAAGKQTVQVYTGQSKTFDAPFPVRRVAVGRPAVADVTVVTPRQIQVTGKTAGATEVTLWDANDQPVEVLVDVSSDLRGLEAQLKKLFPRSTIQLDQLEDVVVVRGTLPKAEHAAQLKKVLEALKLKAVDATRVAGVQQVQLRVRVAEVSRGALRALGINALAGGSEAFGGVQIGGEGSPLVPMNVGVPKGSPVHPMQFAAVSDVSVPSSVTMFGGFPSADLEVFIQALEENQYLQLLAEPNLVAYSGEEADFLAGGEYPIPVVQGVGTNATVTIEYKEYGVRLRFRPTILGDGQIRLEVAPEVSELSAVGAVQIQGFVIPALISRRVQTTIELGSGQTFGLAGLINRSTSARTSKVPGLGDVPVLGALFRSVRYQRNETELVVLVTASLVEPLSLKTMPPLPGEEHRAPDAWELYALGRIEGKAPARLNRKQSEQIKETGLDQLKGPGAWVSYGRQPATEAAQ